MNSNSDRIVMRLGWHHLLFLHWPVEAAKLQRLLPRELEIDTYDGQAYIGLVPFEMSNVHPSWLPHTPLQNRYDRFPEINVRTYVRHHGQNPGVWFFSLDASNLPAVIAARSWFKLPYFWSRIRVQHENNASKYFVRRLGPRPTPAHCALEYHVEDEAAQAAAAGSIEEFLVERYRLYSQRGEALFAGQVRHHPYQLQRAKVLWLRENLVRRAGVSVRGAPPLVHYARGVDVEILPLQRVRPK
jgi:uncharacterized protein YqjF (DUF2071 family)